MLFLDKPIVIKFFGGFKEAYGKNIINLKPKKQSLREVIRKVTEQSYELKKILIDSELDNPEPNAVILVNGVSINLLNGLDTEVDGESEIVLLPVTHGG